MTMPATFQQERSTSRVIIVGIFFCYSIMIFWHSFWSVFWGFSRSAIDSGVSPENLPGVVAATLLKLLWDFHEFVLRLFQEFIYVFLWFFSRVLPGNPVAVAISWKSSGSSFRCLPRGSFREISTNLSRFPLGDLTRFHSVCHWNSLKSFCLDTWQSCWLPRFLQEILLGIKQMFEILPEVSTGIPLRAPLGIRTSSRHSSGVHPKDPLEIQGFPSKNFPNVPAANFQELSPTFSSEVSVGIPLIFFLWNSSRR